MGTNLELCPCVLVTWSCPTLVDCSPPGSSIHGIFPGKNTAVGSLLREIFSTQGWNPGLPHCRQILYHLSHKEGPELCLPYIISQELCYELILKQVTSRVFTVPSLTTVRVTRWRCTQDYRSHQMRVKMYWSSEEEGERVKAEAGPRPGGWKSGPVQSASSFSPSLLPLPELKPCSLWSAAKLPGGFSAIHSFCAW